MRATVAMAADINHKRIAQFGAVYFIGTVKNNRRDITRLAAFDYAVAVAPVFAGQKPDIHATNACGGGVQHIKPVPAIRNHAGFFRQREGLRENARAIGARQCALPQNQHRALGFRQHIGKPVLARDKLRQGLRPGPDKLSIIRQIGWLADRGNGEIARQPALANARVQHRGFKARVCADQQQCIGVFNTGNAGVE